MKSDKVVKFGPGQEFRLDKRVIFVEYESMTGELVKCRFDLSHKTEMIYNDHRILSFDDLTYLYSKDEEVLIKKVLYYEQECHMVIGGKLLIPTKIYFENAGYQQAYETNNKLLRNVANSAYGIASRDWADVLADSARYIHMQRSRCSGKTLWLSAKSIEEEAHNDAIERWLKNTPIAPIKLPQIPEFISDDLEDCEKGVPNTKLVDPNGYFDTDMVMTREEMQYCLNDVAVTEKIFKEEQIMRFDSCKPTIKNVIFNDPATIVMWSDGTKTVVKCGENDIFDPEKGVAMACMKKLLGTNKTGSNYLDKVQEYFDDYDGEQVEKCLAVRQRFMKFLAGCVKNGTDSKDIPPEVTVDKEFEAVTNDDWTVVPADENATAEENGE